jgi:hypothetical protein
MPRQGAWVWFFSLWSFSCSWDVSRFSTRTWAPTLNCEKVVTRFARKAGETKDLSVAQKNTCE